MLSILIPADQNPKFFIFVAPVFLLIADEHNLFSTETSTKTFSSGPNTCFSIPREGKVNWDSVKKCINYINSFFSFFFFFSSCLLYIVSWKTEYCSKVRVAKQWRELSSSVGFYYNKERVLVSEITGISTEFGEGQVYHCKPVVITPCTCTAPSGW